MINILKSHTFCIIFYRFNFLIKPQILFLLYINACSHHFEHYCFSWNINWLKVCGFHFTWGIDLFIYAVWCFEKHRWRLRFVFICYRFIGKWVSYMHRLKTINQKVTMFILFRNRIFIIKSNIQLPIQISIFRHFVLFFEREAKLINLVMN